MRHQRRIAAALTAAVLGTGIATAVPVTAAAAEPPTDGLVLHYALTGDGGTTAVDLSGSGRDGQIIGGAEPSADGLTLDGVDDYVDMPDNIMAGLDEISIAFQVQIDLTLGGVYFIYGMGNTSAGGIGDGYLFTEGNPYRATIASGNWETEENTQASHNLDREVWKHLTYTQSGGTGVLYEDGVEVARNDEVTITPGSIGGGVTTANYIGRSLYAPDPYFKGAVQDFRIYDRALAVDEVETLASPVVSGTLEQDAAELTLGDTSAVVTDLALPTLGAQGSAISWASSDAGVVTAEGVVTRPAFGSEAATATLTATLTRGAESTTRAFDVTVLPEEDDQSRADTAAAELVVHNVEDVRGNLTLLTTGPDGATVSWESSDPAVITATGDVNRPAAGADAAAVELTATVTIGSATATRVFQATVPALPQDADYEGYLFTYFLGEGQEHGEQVYYGLSEGNDPTSWDVLNDGEPVLVSTSGEMGLRDPYIVRSPEGDKFYQIATDLRMWNQSSGSWGEVQRQGSRNIVVWESTDLVNWSESWVVEVAPEEAGNAWAPETFYDEESGEYVVFWASNLYAEDDPEHTGSSYNRMMYSTTRDFRTFSEPAILIDAGQSVIDTTMIEHDGDVYRFSKNEANRNAENPGGKHVFQEVGSSVLADDFQLIAEGVGAGDINQGEGPLVFKSNTEERWYLFIDEYGGRGYVPFTTTDLASGEWTMLAAGEFSFPARFRHGTVLPITQAEYERLLANYQPDALVESVDDVELTVEAGVAPVLPATVTAQFADGSTGPFGVVWDEVHPSSYAAAGHFTVRGTLEAGMPVEARAVVTVTAAPAGVPTFVDVVDGQVFYDEIRWMAEQGLSHGTVVGDVTFFYPAQAVSRQAMAAFIYRYAGADYTPPAGTQSFTDVGPDHPLYAEIEWMHAQGLTEGYADGSFGATRPVSRQAMAAFLHRLAGSPEASSAAPFTDVAAGSQFAEAIGWLAEADITDGYPDGSFGITRPVTRQAMAAFLHRYDEFVSALRVVQG